MDGRTAENEELRVILLLLIELFNEIFWRFNFFFSCFVINLLLKRNLIPLERPRDETREEEDNRKLIEESWKTIISHSHPTKTDQSTKGPSNFQLNIN